MEMSFSIWTKILKYTICLEINWNANSAISLGMYSGVTSIF